MLIDQMHVEFKVFADKVDSLAYSEFEAWEIDTLLRESEDRLIKQKYSGNNIYKTGFEQSQKRTDDLKELVTTKYLLPRPVANFDFYGYKIYSTKLNELFKDINASDPFDGGYMFYLRSRAQVTKANCKSWRSVNLVQQDDLETLFSDPFNKPSPENPVIYFEDGGIFIVAGDSVVNSFQVTFIKRPNQVNLGTYGEDRIECELSEHLHREIVNGAVSLALRNIESERAMIHTQVDDNKTE